MSRIFDSLRGLTGSQWLVVVALALGFGLVAGCGKRDAGTSTDDEPIVDASQYMPGGPPGVLIHRPLSSAMYRFFNEHDRFPRSFNELVETKILAEVPAPPPGKKFAWDPKLLQVIVVDQ
jgi:hypothetical protein